MSEDNYDIDERYYFLPRNYKNSGGIWGGMLSMENFANLFYVLIAIYLFTEIIRGFIGPKIFIGLRVGLSIFGVLLHFGVNAIFNTTIPGIIVAIYNYIKSKKKFRYERRDPLYVRRKKKK